MHSYNDHRVYEALLNAFLFVLGISLEHWIIASLVWGALGFGLFYAINDQSKSDAGAITSGLLAMACGCLFVFGVFAAFLSVIKTVWLAV